ncbi:MAG TPA: MFS transporter [Candidatus Eisenbacteria bacterium]|jgi:MFS family permease|nr:MFS transporter [Candidatus Eisenbacteria bacterium]
MPSGHLRGYIEHYFAPHPSRQMKELFLSTALLNFATGAVMLFEPIYLHSIGFSAVQVLLFYAALYVVYFLLLPLGGKICRRHGYEHTILFSSPFLIIWYLSFFAIPTHPAFVAVAILSLAIQKILYWPGYHANFATWSTGNEGGREVSNMAAIAGLAATFAPAFGGLLIRAAGYKALFIGVSVVILLSNVPLLKTPELYMPQPFPYVPAVKRVFKKENRRKLIGFMGFGEELIALVAWPLFLAIMVPDAALLGAIISFAMLANVAATLYVGRVSDDGNKMAVLRSGTLYTAASWLVRIFVTGGFGAFLIDSFYRISKNMVNVPLLSSLYDGAKRGQVMDDVVLFEMALSLGKILAAVIAAAFLWLWHDSWWAVFGMAACFSLLFAALKDPEPSPKSA